MSRFRPLPLAVSSMALLALGLSSSIRPLSLVASANASANPRLLSELRDRIERYVADRGSLNRFYSIAISATRVKRMRQFTQETLDGLAGLEFDALSHDGKVDYLLFQNQLRHVLRELDFQERSLTEVAPLLPFSQTIIQLEEARRRMELIDAAKAAVQLNGLVKLVGTARSSVEAGLRGESGGGSVRVKRTVAQRAAGMVGTLRNVLGNWYRFHDGYDPVFTWWMQDPYKAADSALQSYATFLRERVVGVRDEEATIGDPIGREALLSELAFEMIPYTPEELISLARTEFAWCEAEMKRASRDLGFADDWQRALEHVKSLHVDPGKQPQLIRDLAREAIEFIEQRDLVTIPALAKETWRMEMMTPQQQLVSPFFLGGETIQVSFPTPTMSHEQKLMSMRGNNIHFSRATVQHELVPGHHLQGFMTARYRPYRSLFGTPFWTEGWALYWELLLWDLNFPRGPEDRVGMLFWRMHRCARIIFSLSFQLEQMTPQECVDFLVDRVGHERANAEAEVRRSFGGGYGPLYQAAYLLGGLQIRALHKELVESGKMSNRSFHDAILQENGMPIEMVRAALTRQALTREHKSMWRFYEK